MSLHEASKIEGTLFTIGADKRKTNGPVMEGEFQIVGESGKIKGAGWTKESKDGVPYLSLQIELNRDIKYYGAIFPTQEKKSDKAPDYFGTLNLGKEKGSPELRIAGWKRKGKESGIPFISLVIEPPRPADHPDARHPETSMSGLPI